MWTEPLTASTEFPADDSRKRLVVLTDGAGRAVAETNYIIDVNAALGEVFYLDRTGTARQLIRAFGLMIRECIRGARAEGVVHYFADHQAPMRRAAAAVSGIDAIQSAGRLDELEVEVGKRVDPGGRLNRVPVEEEQEIADGIPTKPRGLRGR